MVLPTILVAFPFILFFILLIWKKTPLLRVSLLVLVLTSILAAVFWKMDTSFIFGSLAKGFFVAIDIFFIIFGAIFFLDVMKKNGIIKNINIYLKSISDDLRVQVILLAWFLESFFEGIAGFGTPAAIVAPLLVEFGITPINAAIIVLLGNSASGVFGAAGTPIKSGFAGLYGPGFPVKAALFNLVGILVPIFILWFLTKERVDGKKEFREMVPFAVWSGMALSVPSVLTAFLGVEFPTILGSVIGLGLVLFGIKFNFLLPKNKVTYLGAEEKATLPLGKVLLPYAILVLLLLTGKFILGDVGLAIPLPIKHTLSFYNPGFALFAAAVFSIAFFKISKEESLKSAKISLTESVVPFLTTISMSSFAQIMVNSNQNNSGLPSMVNFLAAYVRNGFLPLWAPFLGTFGSFLTGSVTVSNMMFGSFLAEAARQINLNVEIILALTVVGGAMGNMIALADILVAEAALGMKNRERDVVKRVVFPCLISVSIIGVFGLLFLRII